MIKQDLQASIIEIVDKEDYSELNEEVKCEETKRFYIFNKKYGELLKGENMKIIDIMRKQ